MESLSGFLALAAVLVAICSLIAIIRPIARIGLGSRKRALGVLGLSFATFFIAAILASTARQEQPRPEPGTNLSKPAEDTSKAATSASPDNDATPGSETNASSPENEPQPEREPQPLPEPETNLASPAEDTLEAPTSPSPGHDTTPGSETSVSRSENEPQPERGPQPSPEPEPEATFVAHEYKMLEARDTFAGSRKRTRIRIHTTSATTPDTLIGTAMEAAVEAQVAHQSQFVSVFVHANDDPRSEILARVRFAPDGCDISGEKCTNEMWTSAKSVVQVPTEREIAIFEAARQNEDSFQKEVIREIEVDGFDVLMEKVKPLYDELMVMKDEEGFRTVGFSPAGPYNRWLVETKRLRDGTDELQLLRNWNITVGELLQLGLDYVFSKGTETEFTKEVRGRFALAFTSKSGESKHHETDREALLQHLAEQFDATPEEIDATIKETFVAFMKKEDVEIPERLRKKGALTDEQREELKCRMDLQCWGDKHSLRATFACQGHIERLAKYAHEWTDGFMEAKFSHFRWKDPSKGVVTYLGDKIRFQNGFGAWLPHRYSCDYDVLNEQVLDVGAEHGRL